MCIYCGTNKYRKIYENHYGPIPKDETGRTYDIHHIDGNHDNNAHTNLKAVTIQEHYDIHYAQGDWTACLLLSRAMTVSVEEKSKLSSQAAQELIENGTHHFLGETNPSVIASKNGTHRFLDPEWQKEKTRKAIERETHNFLGGSVQKTRIENGTHHFLGETNPSVIASKNGTHSWIGGAHATRLNRRLLAAGTHPTQWQWTCECGKSGKGKSNLSQHRRSSRCPLNKN